MGFADPVQQAADLGSGRALPRLLNQPQFQQATESPLVIVDLRQVALGGAAHYCRAAIPLIEREQSAKRKRLLGGKAYDGAERGTVWMTAAPKTVIPNRPSRNRRLSFSKTA